MKKAVISIVFILSFCLPLAVLAQDLDKKWEIGLGGGYFFGTEEEDGMLRIRDDRIRSFERQLGTYEVSLDDDPMFYLNMGYRFKDYGFFRLQVGYTEYNLEVNRKLHKIPDSNLISTFDILPIAVNFNYFLMRKTSFKPYITAGFTSYVFLDSQEFKTSPSMRLGADFGAGFEYYFTDTFAVNFDMGYHFLKIELQAVDPFTMRGYPQTYEEINAIPDRFEVAMGIKFLVY